MTQATDLTGKLLIAMPSMMDTRFAHSVVFLCAHSPEGAMGLVINKPAPDLSFSDLLEQLSIESEGDTPAQPVHFGGPVECGRGFVLHEYGYHSAISTLDVNDDFAMTATLDILEDIAGGRGPNKVIMALGYAGWGPGQLEGELAQNGWLVCDPDLKLVFDTADGQKWEGALNLMGISALALSAEGGSA